MKCFLLVAFLFVITYGKTQNKNPKLEVHVTPGLFLEAMSNDSLIPAHQKATDRVGDVESYAVQFALPLKNKRFTIKGGIGFSQRHYSISKYTLDDFFVSLFLFDSQLRRDSFNLGYVQFTDNYLQVPASFSYTVTRPAHNFQLAFGINIRSDFLIAGKAKVVFDSIYKVPATSDISYAKQAYTSNASKYVCTIEPYAEASFSVYKKLGLLFQFNMPSYYSSSLDKHLTTSTVELFSFTFGAFYSLK